MIFALTGMLASATACGGSGNDSSGTSGASASSSAGAGSSAGGRPAKPLSGRTYHVVLELLGKGRLNSVYYHVDTDGRATNITLPWKQAQTVHGGVVVAILASGAPGQKLTCRITVNGKVANRQVGEVPQCRYVLPK